MSYLGYTLPNATFQGVRTASFNGTGSQTVFSLPAPAAAVTSLEVLVNNVQQSPYDGSYSVSGSTLTFSEAPSSGTNNVYVIYRDQTFMSTVPGDGTVTPAKLDRSYVNKAGDTMTGTYGFGGFISLQTSDANGYPRINGSSSSAQLGLFRSSGGSEGGMFIGGDASQFSVWSSDFTRRLNVDQSGRVTTPNQPAFQASISVSKSNVSVSPNGVATFSDVQVNRGSHFNGTRFTAPVSGVYRFGGSTATISNSTFRTDLYKNGGLFTIVAEHSDGVSWTIKGWSAIVPLNAGDYAELAFFGTVNGSWTSFNGNLLG